MKKVVMTKELVELVAKQTGQSKATVELVCEGLQIEIAKTMAKGQTARVKWFGVFRMNWTTDTLSFRPNEELQTLTAEWRTIATNEGKTLP